MLKDTHKPSEQILLDEINRQNGMRLLLSDVVFGVPEPIDGGELDVNTQITVDIPAALVVRHWVKYKRWDLAELVSPHEMAVSISGNEGEFSPIPFLDEVNGILDTQFSPSADFSIQGLESVPLFAGNNTYQLTARANSLMLVGSVPINIFLIHTPS